MFHLAEIIRTFTASASMVSPAIGKAIQTSWFLATVAACTLFIWDYLLTFRMEVDLVWKSKWNFMKGLFLFQRYLPFIDTVWLVLNSESDIFFTFSCPDFFQVKWGWIWRSLRVGIYTKPVQVRESLAWSLSGKEFIYIIWIQYWWLSGLLRPKVDFGLQSLFHAILIDIQ